MRLLTRTVCRLVALLRIASPAAGQGLPVAASRQVVLSHQGLERIGPAVQKFINDRQLAGAVTIVARRGEVVQFEAHLRTAQYRIHVALKQGRTRWQHPMNDRFVMQRLPCYGKEYRIDSQKQFDALGTATFLPGDVVLFKKGQQFRGMFAPAGSGTERAAIKIDTYGYGSRPRIDAGGENIAGLVLQNLAYWEVNGLEIANTDGPDNDQGDLFGIYVLVKAREGVYRHIYIDER